VTAVLARTLGAHTDDEPVSDPVNEPVDVSDGRAGSPVSQRRRRVPGLGLALGLALVAALVVAVVLGHQALDQRAVAQNRSDAMAAARQIAVNFSTLDYRTFDRDTARVTAAATGAFRTDFAAQAAQIKQVVVANKSVSTGTVGQAALVSASDKTARVLLALDASVTNTSTSGPTARHYRVQLDLTKVDGHWLASQLQFVG
jgi:Mce-associated membrane protein